MDEKVNLLEIHLKDIGINFIRVEAMMHWEEENQWMHQTARVPP